MTRAAAPAAPRRIGPSADRWVLVTGASRGIGRAVALRLAADGHDLVVAYRDSADAAREVAAGVEALGRRARTLRLDVADRDATRAAIEADIGAHGAYCGLVCNAGVVDDVVFPGMAPAQWDGMIATHLDAFYNVVHPALMPMIRRRAPGRIVTISSTAGQTGNRGQVHYSAAKAGLIGASRALAVELASRQITVNCVAAGLIETDLTRGFDATEMLKAIPVGRAGRPEEVAACVAFLFSPDAAYITRQVIAVNGGLHA
jgi:3-oxoacyl-[acyl-carrier protein] reductase